MQQNWGPGPASPRGNPQYEQYGGPDQGVEFQQAIVSPSRNGRMMRPPPQIFPVPRMYEGDDNIFSRRNMATHTPSRPRKNPVAPFSAPRPNGAVSPRRATGGALPPDLFSAVRKTPSLNLMNQFAGMDAPFPSPLSPSNSGNFAASLAQRFPALASPLMPKQLGAPSLAQTQAFMMAMQQLQNEIDRLTLELKQKDDVLAVWESLLKPNGTLVNFLDACREGNVQAVEFYLIHRVDVDQTERGCTGLMLAAQNNWVGVARALLDHGCPVDGLGNQINQEFFTGETALMFAACAGSLDCLDLLLQRGANVNHESITFMTPLIAAASCGQDLAVELLLRNGAMANYYNPQGEVGTALFAACAQGHANTVALLMSNGASLISQIPPNPQFPPFPLSEMGIVCKLGHANAPDVIFALVENGARVNEFFGPQKRSPLMLAALNDAAHCVDALCLLGSPSFALAFHASVTHVHL